MTVPQLCLENQPKLTFLPSSGVTSFMDDHQAPFFPLISAHAIFFFFFERLLIISLERYFNEYCTL